MNAILMLPFLIQLLFPSPVLSLGEVLRFSSTPSNNNYVILNNPDFTGMETSFTICTWIRPRNNGNSQGVWFSYQVSSSDDNEITINNNPGHTWNVLFNFDLASSATSLEFDVWSHYCDTWDLSSATRRVYKNGEEVANKATTSGRKLKLGGVLVLGQDQDSRGGGFQSIQNFGGDLYNLVVLDKKLSSEEISDLYSNGRCGGLDPDLTDNVVLDWQDFLYAQRNGDVIVERGTCSQWELVRGILDEELLEHLIDHHQFD